MLYYDRDGHSRYAPTPTLLLFVMMRTLFFVANAAVDPALFEANDSLTLPLAETPQRVPGQDQTNETLVARSDNESASSTTTSCRTLATPNVFYISEMNEDERNELRAATQDILETLHAYYHNSMPMMAQMMAQHLHNQAQERAPSEDADVLSYVAHETSIFLVPGMEIGVVLSQQTTDYLNEMLQRILNVVAVARRRLHVDNDHDEVMFMGAPGRRGKDRRDDEDRDKDWRRKGYSSAKMQRDAWNNAPWKRRKINRALSSGAGQSSSSVRGVPAAAAPHEPDEEDEDSGPRHSNYEWRCLLEMEAEDPGTNSTPMRALVAHQEDNVRATFAHLTQNERNVMLVDFIHFMGQLFYQVARAAEAGIADAMAQEANGEDNTDAPEDDGQSLMQTAHGGNHLLERLRHETQQLQRALESHPDKGRLAAKMLWFLRSRYLGLPYEYWRDETQALCSLLIVEAKDEADRSDSSTTRSMAAFLKEWWGKVHTLLVRLDAIDPTLVEGSDAHKESGLRHWNFNSLRGLDDDGHPYVHDDSQPLFDDDSLQMMNEEDSLETSRRQWEACFAEQAKQEADEEEAILEEVRRWDQEVADSDPQTAARKCRAWDDWAMWSEMEKPTAPSAQCVSECGASSSTSMVIPFDSSAVQLTITAHLENMDMLPSEYRVDHPTKRRKQDEGAIPTAGDVPGTAPTPTGLVPETMVEPDETQLMQQASRPVTRAYVELQRPRGLSVAQVHARLQTVNKGARLKITRRLQDLLRQRLRRQTQALARTIDTMQELEGSMPAVDEESSPTTETTEADRFCTDTAQSFLDQFDEYQIHSEDLTTDNVMTILRRLLQVLERRSASSSSLPTIPSTQCIAPTLESTLDAAVARIQGFLERTVGRLPDDQRSRFFKTLTVLLSKAVKQKVRVALMYLKLLVYAFTEHGQHWDQQDATMRLELVMQGIETRVQGELGQVVLPTFQQLPPGRDITVNMVNQELPELNLVVTEIVQFLEGGSDSSDDAVHADDGSESKEQGPFQESVEESRASPRS